MQFFPQEIPRLFPPFLHKYVGNPRLFGFLKPFERFPLILRLNNAHFSAPLTLWIIGAAALRDLLTMDPSKVEYQDINTPLSMACVCGVWTFYSLIIEPRVMMLVVINGLNVILNGHIVYTRLQYMKKPKSALN